MEGRAIDRQPAHEVDAMAPVCNAVAVAKDDVLHSIHVESITCVVRCNARLEDKHSAIQHSAINNFVAFRDIEESIAPNVASAAPILIES